jgi:hypothetical protein
VRVWPWRKRDDDATDYRALHCEGGYRYLSQDQVELTAKENVLCLGSGVEWSGVEWNGVE